MGFVVLLCHTRDHLFEMPSFQFCGHFVQRGLWFFATCGVLSFGTHACGVYDGVMRVSCRGFGKLKIDQKVLHTHGGCITLKWWHLGLIVRIQGRSRAREGALLLEKFGCLHACWCCVV